MVDAMTTPLMFQQQTPSVWGGVAPALAAIFGGLSAAGQPGGFSNFGMGAQSGQQNFQQGQSQQQMMDLRRMQIEQAQEEQRRANQEDAQTQALIENLRNLGRAPGSPTPTQMHGSYGATTGGIQTASGAPQAAMFGDNPQVAAIFQGMLDAGDVKGALGLATEYATQKPDKYEATSPLGKLKADLDAGLIDKATYDAMVKKETYIKPEPGSGSFEVDINGDGVPEFSMGGGGISKEWQSKDNAFANRLDNAVIDMDTVEAEGYDPTASTVRGVSDYVGQRSVGGLIGNVMTSDKGKRWYRGAKEALAVILRKDTGAAVTDHEFELYGPLYIPMPWDDASTKAAKKRALLTMRNSLRQGIGQTPTAPQEAPPPAAPPAPTSATPNRVKVDLEGNVIP
jgi:hypothetical protein